MKILAKLANMKAELIEAFFDKYEVVEIRLTKDSYERVKSDFKKYGPPLINGEISEIWGIPVIVHDAVPSDVAFLIAEKKKKEEGR